MTSSKAYLNHLKASEDLVTTYEAVRAGFVQLALERNKRATPAVQEARALKAAASKISDPNKLRTISGIQSALLTAAGISGKAAGHLNDEDKSDAIDNLIDRFLVPAGRDFIEELVFRFLLTKGDALGGSMRNLGGALAKYKLTRQIISTLSIAGIEYRWLHKKTRKWVDGDSSDYDIEQHVVGLSWSMKGTDRTLLYDKNVPFLGNNVDLILLKCASDDISNGILEEPSKYVSLGELKGGIDPAGADEHWKTASAHITRIRESFEREGVAVPPLFFVGAAIEKKMATEIWSKLESGDLRNAANLTDEEQAASICQWICEL